MKKYILSFAAAAVLALTAQEAKAQTPYKSAIGVVFDGYDGANVGVQYKTAISNSTALQFQAAFGDWVTLGADWQYEKAIRGAEGLAWYAGVGAQLGIPTKDHLKTNFGLRPQVGLEWKIPTIPIGLHLDYKPYFRLTNNSGFVGDGFTFGIKYVLR
ncbi:hypothetical protein J5U18_03925 [Sphingobacteriaceae bacterium WQ 2009]|uniref:Outer membrane protein beta-barrel domain-containing protein n=1 Tax=Rhinopithecimicrobium faecis TaxID=2820698 RepID=A0A8T4H792_9SPHI|nr:hypothetical protein [Sphingobacteriaceae bacterium WQ 2009]